MTLDPAPRTRRSILAAVAAAGGALVARAFGGADPVSAVNGDTLKVGQTVTGSYPTVVVNWSTSSSAVGFKGRTSATGAGPNTVGVVGESNAQNGTGVEGIATSTGGTFTTGVLGSAVNGRGVVGSATGTAGANYGVYGRSYAANGYGVFGRASATGGTNYGVYGQSDSVSGRGVYGTNTGGGVGVYGQSSANGSAIQGYGQAPGYGYGVSGLSDQASGVIGGSFLGSGFAAGVYGNSVSPGGAGVYGVNTYAGHGVRAHTYGGTAVYATASYGAGGFAYAGWFDGATHVNGTLSKSGGAFLIDHPQDPANQTLAHSFVEAPEMLNIYRGNAMLGANGRATVQLPSYFHALNEGFSYQLTAIGGPAPDLHIAKKIANGTFEIAGGAAGQEVAWQVTGARADAWAKANPLRVEATKTPKDRGRYLNPEAFAKARREGINYQPTPDPNVEAGFLER